MFFVYVLYSEALNRYYVGQSANLVKRMTEHLAGLARFTCAAKDWELVFVQCVSDRRDAVLLERRIKKAKSRKTIERFVADPRNQIAEWKSLHHGV
jgi:putative endonuclease